MRTSRAFGQFPFVAKQVLEEIVAPLRRRRGPGDFQTASDRVAAFACAEAALPAQALLLDARPLRLRTNKRRIARAVSLAEGMATGNQCNRFSVVHSQVG